VKIFQSGTSISRRACVWRSSSWPRHVWRRTSSAITDRPWSKTWPASNRRVIACRAPPRSLDHPRAHRPRLRDPTFPARPSRGVERAGRGRPTFSGPLPASRPAHRGARPRPCRAHPCSIPAVFPYPPPCSRIDRRAPRDTPPRRSLTRGAAGPADPPPGGPTEARLATNPRGVSSNQ
jgi:hypothetical protein